MVQALAFAELFAGGILFLCGYKGYTPAEVVKGEAGAAKPLGKGSSQSGSSAGGTGSSSSGAPGSTSPHESATGSPLGIATAPSAAGALTWPSLERQIKAGKLTMAQVEADERKLLNQPPVTSNARPGTPPGKNRLKANG